MSIKTPDSQALDLLSSPPAVIVRLQRRVTYDSDEAAHRTDAAGKRWHAAVDYPGTAVFWPGAMCDEDNCRRLDGEIKLSKHLKPSSAMMHFSVTVRTNFSIHRHGTRTSVSNSFVLTSTMLWYFHSKRLALSLQTKVRYWQKKSRLGHCSLKGQGRKYTLMKGKFVHTSSYELCIFFIFT